MAERESGGRETELMEGDFASLLTSCRENIEPPDFEPVDSPLRKQKRYLTPEDLWVWWSEEVRANAGGGGGGGGGGAARL